MPRLAPVTSTTWPAKFMPALLASGQQVLAHHLAHVELARSGPACDTRPRRPAARHVHGAQAAAPRDSETLAALRSLMMPRSGPVGAVDGALGRELRGLVGLASSRPRVAIGAQEALQQRACSAGRSPRAPRTGRWRPAGTCRPRSRSRRRPRAWPISRPVSVAAVASTCPCISGAKLSTPVTTTSRRFGQARPCAAAPAAPGACRWRGCTRPPSCPSGRPAW